MVTIYLPGEQQTLSVGPVENVAQLVTQPQLRDRLWWPGALLTDSAAKAKALKDYQHVMAQLASWEAEADDDVGRQRLNPCASSYSISISLVAYRSNWTLILCEWMRTAIPRWSGTIRYTVQRPVTITLLGAVSGAGQLPWLAGRSVTDYLQDHTRLAGADKNNVMVITPEGETVVAPVALWNKRHVEPPPGG